MGRRSKPRDANITAAANVGKREHGLNSKLTIEGNFAGPPHSPEVLAKALETMERLAPDLIEMLGLREPEPGNSRPIDIHCPSCPASPGGRCVSKAGNEIGHFHRARVRKAADTVAADQLVQQILEEA